MSGSVIPTSTILARCWADVVPSVDCDVATGALFALFVQHAWGSDEKSSRPLSDECCAPCLSDTQQTALAEADEEVCDFVGVSAVLGKAPVYNTTEDIDQTLELLDVHSVPEWQTGLFLGVGLVSTICAALDTSTRKIRRAGKPVLRKKNSEKKKKALGAAYNDKPLYERVPNETCEDGLSHTR